MSPNNLVTKFLNHLEKEIDVKKNTFRPNKKLKDIPEWDSLAIMVYLSVASKKYKKNIKPDVIKKCIITNDLAKILDIKD